jgi:two-component system chemotaxis response regulator CheY
MIVDDDPSMRQLIRLLLRRDDCQVVGEAADGEEAVNLYERIRPDIVLLDLMMPRVDGWTALARIRQEHPDAQVVVCSALRNPHTRAQAYQAGARDYILKPFAREDLQRAILGRGIAVPGCAPPGNGRQ